MLSLDGNDEIGQFIHNSVDTSLKPAQNLIFRDIGQFISSTKLKSSLHYSPVVKLAHGHVKVIHVTTLNDGFNTGPMKKKSPSYSESKLTVESCFNIQFYSIPNIDDAMNRQKQNQCLFSTQA